MKYILLLMFLSGCGCNVGKGDRVIYKATGEKGTVLSVGKSGGTDECRVAFELDSGDVRYWYYGFELKAIGD